MTPWDPRRGWHDADLPRRAAAVLVLPVVALLVVVLAAGLQGLAALWLVVGPACCYSLARVLRPEPREAGRTTRHLLAAAGTAYAAPVVAVLLGITADADSDIAFTVYFLCGIPALVFGVLTAVWGLVAAWLRTPWGAGPARPRRR